MAILAHPVGADQEDHDDDAAIPEFWPFLASDLNAGQILKDQLGKRNLLNRRHHIEIYCAIYCQADIFIQIIQRRGIGIIARHRKALQCCHSRSAGNIP